MVQRHKRDIEAALLKAGFASDGKMTLYDGRTGEAFTQRVTHVSFIHPARPASGRRSDFLRPFSRPRPCAERGGPTMCWLGRSKHERREYAAYVI